jgi:hypothetical protein
LSLISQNFLTLLRKQQHKYVHAEAKPKKNNKELVEVFEDRHLPHAVKFDRYFPAKFLQKTREKMVSVVVRREE